MDNWIVEMTYGAISIGILSIAFMLVRYAWNQVSIAIKQRFDIELHQAFETAINAIGFDEEQLNHIVIDQSDEVLNFVLDWLKYRGWRVNDVARKNIHRFVKSELRKMLKVEEAN